jgi:hypothetical protein
MKKTLCCLTLSSLSVISYANSPYFSLKDGDGFKPTEISKLEIETTERHQYSKEFAALAKDFYLKL